jgi:hypothetical protein
MRLLTAGLLLVAAIVGAAAPLHYDLAIAVDEHGTLVGTATVRGVAPADWPAAVFRLYPAIWGTDLLTLTGAWVEGQEVAWESVKPTTVTVSAPATAGQTFSVTLSFTGRVPEFTESRGYGTYARSDHAVVLGLAYPILAPRDGSWIVHPAYPWGDALVAEVADYELDLVAPAGWSAVASGAEVAVGPGRYRIEGENLREMAIVLLRGYEVQTASVAGVELRSYFRPEHARAGRAGLDITADAIQSIAYHLGPHPFPELDVVAVPMRVAAGMEYPGLILVGEEFYERYPQDPLFFPMIFAHEVAHQWWYAEVGNDPVAEPWVDEALATYTSGLYFAAQDRFSEIHRYWESGYAWGRMRNRDAGIASPLGAFPGGVGYGGIVYSGGALFFHAVRERMGDDPFFTALRRYREEFRWRIARGADLLRILREESPQPLDALIAAWLGF